MCVGYDDKAKMSATIITPKEDVDHQFWYPKRNRVINEYKYIKDYYSWSDEVEKESDYAINTTSPKIYDLRTPQKKSGTKKKYSSDSSDSSDDDDGEEEEYTLVQVQKLLLHDDEKATMTVDSMSSSNSSMKTGGRIKTAKSVTFQTTEHQQLDFPKKEFTIQEAYKLDEDGWRPVVESLLEDCLNNIQSFKLVDAMDVPHRAIILPASVLCKLKVDTKHAGQKVMKYARFYIQDAKKRRQVNPN
jgi:hypothetical protein